MTTTAHSNQESISVSGMSSLLTFLVADLRGYTQFSAERGDVAAAQLSERFLGLCREVIPEYGGQVFGTAGDQAAGVFSSAHAALRAALHHQSRLAYERAVFPDL